MTQRDLYVIIISALAGEATDTERSILFEWLQKSERNRDEYTRLASLYKKLKVTQKEKEIDVEKAWEIVRAKSIDKKRSFTPMHYLRYSAIIFILISLGLIFIPDDFFQSEMKDVTFNEIINIEAIEQPTLHLNNGELITLNDTLFSREEGDIIIRNEANNQLLYETEEEAAQLAIQNNHLLIPKGQTYHLTLSDGTRIWLNSETELFYPSVFSKEKREVRLNGEAYFEITHNKNAPFIVRTNDIEVKVLGTSFNLNSYKNSKQTRTTLVEGSVAISTPKGEELIISPSEQLTYDKDMNTTNIKTVDTRLFTSWVSGEYIFRNAPLEEILKRMQLKDAYLIEYENNDLINKRYTITLDMQTNIDSLLEVISYTSDVKLTRKDNTIHINKERKKGVMPMN